jgi:hypothetical protein
MAAFAHFIVNEKSRGAIRVAHPAYSVKEHRNNAFNESAGLIQA